MMPRVIIDPGHGGSDHGAEAGGVSEKDLNLAIGMELQRSLVGMPMVVCMTRSLDVHMSLQERGEAARDRVVDFALSIHINANTNQRVHGIEFYHLQKDMFGRTIGATGLDASPMRLRSSKLLAAWNNPADTNDNWLQRPQNVLESYSAHGIPSVLAECGYLTNPDDFSYLTSAFGPSSVVCALRACVVRAAQALETYRSGK